jgi:hypothetical protein
MINLFSWFNEDQWLEMAKFEPDFKGDNSRSCLTRELRNCLIHSTAAILSKRSVQIWWAATILNGTRFI